MFCATIVDGNKPLLHGEQGQKGTKTHPESRFWMLGVLIGWVHGRSLTFPTQQFQNSAVEAEFVGWSCTPARLLQRRFRKK